MGNLPISDEKCFNAPSPGSPGLNSSQKEALATLIVAMDRGEGWAMVAGQKGAGKADVINWLRANLAGNVKMAVLNSTGIGSSLDLFRRVAGVLDLPDCNYKSRFLFDLRERLESLRQQGDKVLLVVQDAHLLNDELLRELELLGNSDHFSPKVLNIFIFAQPEFLETLEGMGATNLKHNLRRFRRLERRQSERPSATDRRRNARDFQPINYSISGHDSFVNNLPLNGDSKPGGEK